MTINTAFVIGFLGGVVATLVAGWLFVLHGSFEDPDA